MFYVFIADRQYDEGNLSQHLDNLRTYVGAPDCWSIADTIRDAVRDADKLLEDPNVTSVAIVDPDTDEVIDYLEKVV